MALNLDLYRSNLMLAPLYVASTPFFSSLGWHSEKSGHVLVVKKTSENAVASIVGHVLEKRLDCGPTGNFQKGKYGKLDTAKFHLLLGKPTGTPFADDFEKALTTFNKIQNDIASTQNRVNFMAVDGKEKGLWFTRAVFEKREDGILEPEMDTETENWPVSPDLRADLDDIKESYRVVPLPVFAANKFVEVADVNAVLKGALVEVHFEFHHYNIKPRNQDSFNATVQQILVLQPGFSRPATAYKRKNVREGPVRLKQNPASERESLQLEGSGQNPVDDAVRASTSSAGSAPPRHGEVGETPSATGAAVETNTEHVNPGSTRATENEPSITEGNGNKNAGPTTHGTARGSRKATGKEKGKDMNE